MKSLLARYKYDIVFLILITIIFSVLSFLFSEYYVNMLIDTGREAYLPELMLKGKLLYKDLFNIFGPLAYQVNTFLYETFGNKLSTLGIAGNICSVLILYSTYFISRMFFSTKLSICTLFLVLVTCVFSPSVFNFIYPYSYSLVYSYAAFMWSVLLFLVAFKNRQNNISFYLLGSYFLMGISLSAKIEYLPFALMLILYSVFVYKQSLLKIAVNMLAMLIVPLICYGYLFYQGVTINDFMNNFYYLKKYASSPTLHYFYSHHVGTMFSFALFKKIVLPEFFKTFLFIVVYGLSYVAVAQSTDKPKIIKPEYIVMLVGLFCYKLVNPLQLYTLVPYIIYAIFIYEVIIKIRNKQFDIKNDIFFAFITISIISMLKTAFILDIREYGSFTITFSMITILVFILNNLPKFEINLLRKDIENLLSTFLVIFTIAFIPLQYNFVYDTLQINSEKAVFHLYPSTARYMNEIFDYIRENVKQNESVLLVPEGSFVNYATNLDMKLYNYQSLMPPYIDTFGIDKIIKDIDSAKIDYIILSPRSLDEYSDGYVMCAINPKYEENATQRLEEKQFCDYIKSAYDVMYVKDYIAILKNKNK
ncbi:MAG: hypothetical protein ACI37S_06460 [Candidatus Gastranaerophilaceae bacterium]